MLKLSNYSGQVQEGQKSARKRIGSRVWLGIGLGALILTVLGFLPGCGSDSTPGPAKGEKRQSCRPRRNRQTPDARGAGY